MIKFILSLVAGIFFVFISFFCFGMVHIFSIQAEYTAFNFAVSATGFLLCIMGMFLGVMLMMFSVNYIK